MSELSKNLLEENVENVEGDILKEVLARRRTRRRLRLPEGGS